MRVSPETATMSEPMIATPTASAILDPSPPKASAPAVVAYFPPPAVILSLLCSGFPLWGVVQSPK